MDESEEIEEESLMSRIARAAFTLVVAAIATGVAEKVYDSARDRLKKSPQEDE